MTSGRGGVFSAEEIVYLKTLPAVADATRNRIIYAESFKVDCVLRYAQGESPVQLFREAGLDPSLIGYKRIECAIARWRRQMNVAVTPMKRTHARRSHAGAANPLSVAGGATSFVPQPIGARGDIRDVLIAQQVRRIDELERQVDALSRRLQYCSAQHDAVGEPGAEVPAAGGSDSMGASDGTGA